MGGDQAGEQPLVRAAARIVDDLRVARRGDRAGRADCLDAPVADEDRRVSDGRRAVQCRNAHAADDAHGIDGAGRRLRGQCDVGERRGARKRHASEPRSENPHETSGR